MESEVDPQETVDTCRGSSVLIVKNLYFNLVHFLLHSGILASIGLSFFPHILTPRERKKEFP